MGVWSDLVASLNLIGLCVCACVCVHGSVGDSMILCVRLCGVCVCVCVCVSVECGWLYMCVRGWWM